MEYFLSICLCTAFIRCHNKKNRTAHAHMYIMCTTKPQTRNPHTGIDKATKTHAHMHAWTQLKSCGVVVYIAVTQLRFINVHHCNYLSAYTYSIDSTQFHSAAHMLHIGWGCITISFLVCRMLGIQPYSPPHVSSRLLHIRYTDDYLNSK